MPRAGFGAGQWEDPLAGEEALPACHGGREMMDMYTINDAFVDGLPIKHGYFP